MAEQVIKQIQNTMYDRMEFPTVDYQAFPRAIPVVDGKVQPTPYDAKHKPHPIVIVQNQGELDELMSADVTLVPISDAADSPLRVENDDDVRADLYRRADQAGAKIDKRLSTPKFEEALEAHLAKGDVV